MKSFSRRRGRALQNRIGVINLFFLLPTLTPPLSLPSTKWFKPLPSPSTPPLLPRKPDLLLLESLPRRFSTVLVSSLFLPSPSFHLSFFLAPFALPLTLFESFLGCDYTVCTYPAEFCEFGASLSRCKAWLEEEHPKLFQQYYSEGELVLLFLPFLFSLSLVLRAKLRS